MKLHHSIHRTQTTDGEIVYLALNCLTSLKVNSVGDFTVSLKHRKYPYLVGKTEFLALLEAWNAYQSICHAAPWIDAHHLSSDEMRCGFLQDLHHAVLSGRQDEYTGNELPQWGRENDD